jgi:hypothetical protein
LYAISEALYRVPVSRPRLEAVAARGRARQRRRRAAGATAALTAAAAVTVTAVPGDSHPVNRPARVALAAWTVSRQAGGDIRVTVSELSDPAGLQRTLRADGVRASVTFLGQPNPACRPLQRDPARLGKIFPRDPSGAVHRLPGGVNLDTGGKAGGNMVIDPAAIPSGVGLQLAFHTEDGPTRGHPTILGQTKLVHASQQCTGS